MMARYGNPNLAILGAIVITHKLPRNHGTFDGSGTVDRVRHKSLISRMGDHEACDTERLLCEDVSAWQYEVKKWDKPCPSLAAETQ